MKFLSYHHDNEHIQFHNMYMVLGAIFLGNTTFFKKKWNLDFINVFSKIPQMSSCDLLANMHGRFIPNQGAAP